jgi:hypothetical protein
MQQGAAALGSLVVLGIVAVVTFGIFLLMRELWCWYWKINEALRVLHDLQAVLRNIDKNLAARPTPAPQASADLFASPIR